MRNPTHLTRSRHGIFYLRWRLRSATEVPGSIAFLKISLGTRDPKEALKLAQIMSAKAVSLGYGPGCRMRYEELRAALKAHFTELLARKRERIAEAGPLSSLEIQILESSAELGEEAVRTGDPFLLLEDTENQVLERFIAKYELPIEPGSKPYENLRRMMPAAYRDYLRAVIKHNESLGSFDFNLMAEPQATLAGAPSSIVALSLLADLYFQEAEKGGQWAGKTKFEKSDHLNLLKEVLDQDTDVRSITLEMSHSVKSVLLHYPRNRNKNPATRNRSLEELIKHNDIEKINAQTINKYLQTYGTMFEWARKNGYVTENVFSGLTIRSTKRSAIVRKDFESQQISRIYNTIINNEGNLINKDYQKSGPLIGLYTGARLNEIAQIHLADIKLEDDIWYFDLNDDNGKSLKTAASKRRVPVHPRLLEIGLLGYVHTLRSKGEKKLFPSFAYCPKNGWGRALGRWFNDTFLPELGMKSKSLVFHSLRHTVTNSLQRADVQDNIVKSIVGHTRSDMLGKHYSSSGFKLRQLHEALLKLPY